MEEKLKVMNIDGNYNHENEGVITEEFLTQVIKAAGKDMKYITVNGYFNLGKPDTMSLQQVLNFMYSKNYEFKAFISQERNIQAEMLFKRV